jgi:hypothetical protein
VKAAGAPPVAAVDHRAGAGGPALTKPLTGQHHHLFFYYLFIM